MWIWFSLAVLLVVLEMLTGTFYLLMTAGGALVGGLVAWAGGTLIVQILAASVVAGVLVLALRRWLQKTPAANEATRNADVNLDIGQVVQVAAWGPDRAARIRYRGAEWNVRLADGEAVTTGRFRVVAVEGSTLIVSPVASE